MRPLETLALALLGTLAIIKRIAGPSYRPLGAVLAVLGGGVRVTTLSSESVVGDVA